MQNDILILEELTRMLSLMGVDNKKLINALNENKKILKTDSNNSSYVLKESRGDALRKFLGVNLRKYVSDVSDVPGRLKIRTSEGGELTFTESAFNNLLRKLETVLPDVGTDEFKLLDSIIQSSTNLAKQLEDEFFKQKTVGGGGLGKLQYFRALQKLKKQYPSKSNDDLLAELLDATNDPTTYRLLKSKLLDDFEQYTTGKKTIEPEVTNFDKDIYKVPEVLLNKNKGNPVEATENFQTWLNKNYPNWNTRKDGTKILLQDDPLYGKTAGYGTWGPKTKSAWDDPAIQNAYLKFLKEERIGNILYESPEEVKQFKNWLYRMGIIDEATFLRIHGPKGSAMSGEKSPEIDALWNTHKARYHDEQGMVGKMKIITRKVSEGEIKSNPKLKRIRAYIGGVFGPNIQYQIFGIFRKTLFIAYRSIVRLFRGAEYEMEMIVNNTLYAIRQFKDTKEAFQSAADGIQMQILMLRRGQNMIMSEFITDFEKSVMEEFPEMKDEAKTFFTYLKTQRTLADAGKSQEGSDFADLMNFNKAPGFKDFFYNLWPVKESINLMKRYKEFQSGVGFAAYFLYRLSVRAVMVICTGRGKTVREYVENLMNEGILPSLKIPLNKFRGLGIKIPRTNLKIPLPTSIPIPNPFSGLYGIILWGYLIKWIFYPAITAFIASQEAAEAGALGEIEGRTATFAEYYKNQYYQKSYVKFKNVIKDASKESTSTARFFGYMETLPWESWIDDYFSRQDKKINGAAFQATAEKLKQKYFKEMRESQAFTEEEIENSWNNAYESWKDEEFTEVKERLEDIFKAQSEKRFDGDKEGFIEYLKSINKVILSANEGYDDEQKVGKSEDGETYIYSTNFKRWIPLSKQDEEEERLRKIYEEQFKKNMEGSLADEENLKFDDAIRKLKYAEKDLDFFPDDSEEAKKIDSHKKHIEIRINNVRYNQYISKGFKNLTTKNYTNALINFNNAATQYPYKIEDKEDTNYGKIDEEERKKLKVLIDEIKAEKSGKK